MRSHLRTSPERAEFLLARVREPRVTNQKKNTSSLPQASAQPRRSAEHTYDAASNRTGLTAPDGSTTNYVYDALNRLTDQTNSWAGHFIFGYDDLSRRTSLTRPNGVNTSYNYDNLSRLLSVLHQQGASTVDGAVYTYDNAGNRLSKQNLLNNITEHYDYDAIYQLKHVIQDLSGGGQTTTESYTYDQVGNRLSALNVAQYNYDSSNHLNSSSDGVSYTYDNNGNTLTKTDANGITQYAWDFENRLTSVTLPGSGGVVTFKYDPFGRRVQKSSASGTANYVYDGANIVAELNSAGAVTAKYAQGSGVDQPLAISRGGVIALYDADGLGSITSLYDSAGAQAATHGFTSFGNTSSTGTLINPFGYTGREWGSETGLYYYRARYYDSGRGRFINEDPIRFRGGNNFYSYAGNSPTNFRDPSGLDYTTYTSVLIPVIYVNANITIYGPGANEKLAAVWQKAITDAWNKNPGYRKCKVKFNVQVIADSAANDWHRAKQAGSHEAQNFIYVPVGSPGGDLGDPHINLNMFTGVIPSETFSWTVAHEFGHLLHLWDTTLIVGGHKFLFWGRDPNDIMSEGDVVTQHDINKIIEGGNGATCGCN